MASLPRTSTNTHNFLQQSQTTQKEFVFVDWIPKDDVFRADKSITIPHRPHNRTRTEIRSQAARSSANTRLETIRKRSGDGTGPHGQRAAELLCGGEFQQSRKRKRQQRRRKNNDQLSSSQDVNKDHDAMAQCCRDRDTSVTVHAHKLLGGTIPKTQADAAILGQFLQRFKTGHTTERPWVSLVMTACESDISKTAALPFRALQANASALCANDLQQPEMHTYATNQYLSAIVQLQSELKSPRWHSPAVMYTCMIMTLFECIQSNNPSARGAHVSGVASLIQQRGPENFKAGLEHRTFRYYRINILMKAIVDRRPTFLADPAWKSIPFAGDCPPKTILDLLVDILLDIPAVLAAVEALQKGDLARFTAVQKAFELAYWVRTLIGELERWKDACIWTHPAIRTSKLHLQNLGVVALCELGTGLEPYDAKLGEALNCYNAAHLVLARIVKGLTARSLVMRTFLFPPYSLRDLVAAIVLVSERHISSATADMVSMIVTTFPLKVAQSTTEVDEPLLLEKTLSLLDSLNASFNRRFNIKYSVGSKMGEYDA